MFILLLKISNDADTYNKVNVKLYNNTLQFTYSVRVFPFIVIFQVLNGNYNESEKTYTLACLQFFFFRV